MWKLLISSVMLAASTAQPLVALANQLRVVTQLHPDWQSIVSNTSARLPVNHQEHIARGNRLVFSPQRLVWAYYGEGGKLERMGPAAGGGATCSLQPGKPCYTPEGEYAVLAKRSSEHGPFTTFHIESVGSGAAMEWGIHPGKLGVNDTNGCVHVSFADAQLIQELVNDETVVVVEPYAPSGPWS